MFKLLKGVLSTISRHWPSRSQLTLFGSRELLASMATLPNFQTGKKTLCSVFHMRETQDWLQALTASGSGWALRLAWKKWAAN